MRFLIDQNLPAVLADWLIAEGHVAEHTRVLGLVEADDSTIARRASETGAVVITKDGDFRRLASPPPDGPQVIWVRIGNTTNPRLFGVWSRVWPDVLDALNAGEALVEIA